MRKLVRMSLIVFLEAPRCAGLFLFGWFETILYFFFKMGCANIWKNVGKLEKEVANFMIDAAKLQTFAEAFVQHA